MAYLFFPGRHLVTTSFQEKYLWDNLRLPISKLDLLNVSKVSGDESITHVVFGVTSANQDHSRYNPLPFYLRAIGLDRFAKQYKESLGVDYSIVYIPHIPPTDRFAELVLKYAKESEIGLSELTAENTIVLSSTPAVISQFQNLGFGVLPAEYAGEGKDLLSETPTDIVKKAAELGGDWSGNEEFLGDLSSTHKAFWEDYPYIPQTIARLWNDPILTEEGSLTESRDYGTYTYGMGHTDLMDIKYNDIKEVLLEGRIVDEGCADCTLIQRITQDFPDSDIIGIDLASEFIARCLERQRAGDFKQTFVRIHQRNLMSPVFENDSIDTTICNSTTHEIWSYGSGEKDLKNYLDLKYKQTRRGGRLVIRDVVGPEGKDKIIYMKLVKGDGSNEDPLKHCANDKELGDYVATLSTHARFLRFAEEYLQDMRREGRRGENTTIQYETDMVDGEEYIVIRLKDAVEFITKKDYTDNWRSELNEEFAFWSFSDWKNALVEAGFSVVENPNHPERSSRGYVNPWIVENRFEGTVELFAKNKTGELKKLPYPPTNMVLVAEKNF